MNKKVMKGIFFGIAMCGALLHADSEVAFDAQEEQAVDFNADELAFAAKLSDQNRKAFLGLLDDTQRKSAMIAMDNGANPDDAVRNLVAAIQMKNQAIVQADDAATADVK